MGYGQQWRRCEIESAPWGLYQVRCCQVFNVWRCRAQQVKKICFAGIAVAPGGAGHCHAQRIICTEKSTEMNRSWIFVDNKDIDLTP